MTRTRFLRSSGRPFSVRAGAVRLATLAALSLPMAAPAAAATYSVSPGDDIQAAIDSAVTGDTILFAPGTYTLTQQLHIYNKGITLKGTGKALGTIIERDPNSASLHRLLFIEGQTGSYDPGISTVVEGFTFRNGVAPLAGPENGLGGNIYVKEAPYTVIQKSIIEHGLAGQYGGGIDMEVGGTLRDSIVRNNATVNGAQNQGGGVYLRYGGNTIENTFIHDNWADVGGGVAVQNSGIPNDPGLDGADSRSRIVNATIADNFADGASGFYGGGLGAQLQGKEAFVTDSIVWNNTSSAGASNITNIPFSGGTLTVTYTDTTAPNYAGTGNIFTDPLFAGSGTHAWDYYKLQDGSPALVGSSSGSYMGANLSLECFLVPEPSTLALAGLGFLALAGCRWRRHRRQAA